MLKRIKTGVGAVAALGALALGGSAIASAASSHHKAVHKAHHHKAVHKGHHSATHRSTRAGEPTGPDRDNVQSGDQSTPDVKGSKSSETSQENAPESSGESTANNDGPGGHADEPGNANADHQFQGQE